MKQPGYGAEIIRRIDAMPYEALMKTEVIAAQLVEQFEMPVDKAKSVVNVKLKRMADAGEIKRVQKGVYCKVKQTVFGPVIPDLDKLMVKELTWEGEARIGYKSGDALLNQMGLTTQIPRSTEITTNRYNTCLPEVCRIVLKKPKAEVTDENWKYLQFLDAFTNMPHAFIDIEHPSQRLHAVIETQELDKPTLIYTARRCCQPQLVLRLIDLLMEA